MEPNTETRELSLKVTKMLLEASIAPLVLFLVMLVILHITKPRYSIIKRFQLAMLGEIFFFVYANGRVYLTTDIWISSAASFTNTAFGGCGLGLALFAYRLSKLRGIPIWTIIPWILITSVLLLSVGERAFYLIKRAFL